MKSKGQSIPPLFFHVVFMSCKRCFSAYIIWFWMEFHNLYAKMIVWYLFLNILRQASGFFKKWHFGSQGFYAYKNMVFSTQFSAWVKNHVFALGIQTFFRCAFVFQVSLIFIFLYAVYAMYSGVEIWILNWDLDSTPWA